MMLIRIKMSESQFNIACSFFLLSFFSSIAFYIILCSLFFMVAGNTNKSDNSSLDNIDEPVNNPDNVIAGGINNNVVASDKSLINTINEEELLALLEQEKALLRPESVSSFPREFASSLHRLLLGMGVDTEVVIGGSWAKGTFLPGDHDVDLFVRFNPSYSDAQMSSFLEQALKTLGNPLRVKGSRDYFQLEKNGFLFEVVPVARISSPSDARNVTDLSYLHVSFVLGKTAENPSLPDEIRLLKQFCKSCRCYGAESFINGFSGHVIDLLVIHYGSFLNVIRAAALSWGSRVVLPPDADISSFSKSKVLGPLVVVDPVQPGRNAASAVSKKRFLAFKNCASSFLKNPSLDFFVVKPVTKDYLSSLFPGKNLFVYELFPLRGSKDVVGTKLLKAHQFFVDNAKRLGFSVVDEDFYFDGVRGLAFIVTLESRLEPFFHHKGPFVSDKRDADRFLKAHSSHEVRVVNNRLVAIIPRKHLTLDSLFSEVVKSDFFSSRCSSAKII